MPNTYACLLVFPIFPPSVCTLVLFINPRRACAERVTVVVSCVCMYVCMSVRTRYSDSTRN